jgi:HD domain
MKPTGVSGASWSGPCAAPQARRVRETGGPDGPAGRDAQGSYSLHAPVLVGIRDAIRVASLVAILAFMESFPKYESPVEVENLEAIERFIGERGAVERTEWRCVITCVPYPENMGDVPVAYKWPCGCRDEEAASGKASPRNWWLCETHGPAYAEWLYESRRPPAVSAKFQHAVWYASAMHERQYRKGTDIPYVAHLLAVASIVMEAGGDEEEAIAALLHDGPEDQGGRPRLGDIRRHFGAHVATIVEHCSDTLEAPKPAWRERKRAYIERLAASTSVSTLLVSAADKLHNARSTLRDLKTTANTALVWRRFGASPAETIKNYHGLIAAYQNGVHDRRREQIVRELVETVDELAAFVTAESTSEEPRSVSSSSQ